MLVVVLGIEKLVGRAQIGRRAATPTTMHAGA
jgi:iron(III) transport system permease protein